MGRLCVPRYGLWVFNRMVSFSKRAIRNPQPATRNIIFQCKTTICLKSTSECRVEFLKRLAAFQKRPQAFHGRLQDGHVGRIANPHRTLAAVAEGHTGCDRHFLFF